MEHPHQHPLHWSYPNTTSSQQQQQQQQHQNTWIPPPNKKRVLSDSECDDVFSEESSKEQYDIISPDRSSNNENDSCQLLSRKRRRGVIEKKRRDKINSSLSELKRLVPSACEKQGSAKLEKAEILQLTVDHLKTIGVKGSNLLTSYDHQRIAVDYHLMGFKECAAEVARYLVSIEGMDIQDPLRLRLMSHLQCFVAQREITAKSGTNANWMGGNYQTAYPPPPAVASSQISPHSASAAYHQNYPTQTSTGNSYLPHLTPPIPGVSVQQHCSSGTQSSTTTTNTITSHSNEHHSTHNLHYLSSETHYPISHDSHGPVYTDLSSSVHRGTHSASSSLAYGSNPQYPSGYASNSVGSPGGPYNGNGMKPYRPWGAEMAY